MKGQDGCTRSRVRLCRKTRSGFERLIFRLTVSGCIDDITNIACFAVFARRKNVSSRADDGVFRQSLVPILQTRGDCMEQSFLTYEETDMAVFKEKNGVPKAGGYLRGRSSARIRPGLSTFEQSISPHPQVVRDLGRDSANGRNVRAAATTSDGSIRKGGESKKNN